MNFMHIGDDFGGLAYNHYPSVTVFLAPPSTPPLSSRRSMTPSAWRRTYAPCRRPHAGHSLRRLRRVYTCVARLFQDELRQLVGLELLGLIQREY